MHRRHQSRRLNLTTIRFGNDFTMCLQCSDVGARNRFDTLAEYMSPKLILTITAVILALLTYWPGSPTLPVAVICLAVANFVP
jgi:hypothetical protein